MKKYMASLYLLGVFVAGYVYADCISGDCENGHGTFITSDGSKYVGQWKDGKMHGQGTTTSDGWKYVGQFENNYRHGQGTLYKADGSILQKGRWENGEYVNK